MLDELKNFLVEGLVAKQNKFKKDSKIAGGHPFRVAKSQGRDKLAGTFRNDRIDKHQAKRGVKTKGVFEAALFEGLVKKTNKAAKNKFLDNKGREALKSAKPKMGTYNDDKYIHARTAGREALKKDITNPGHAALNVAAGMRQNGNKTGAKLFTKASKGHTKNTKAFETSLIKVVGRILNEGRDDTSTDPDSISNAGGDAGEYAKIKAAKTNPKAASVKANRLRRSVLGHKKDGNYKRGGELPGGKDGAKSKPLPLKLKGKPSPGKAVSPASVRGKSVNTSRLGTHSGAKRVAVKADMNNDAFGKLVQGLMKSKKQ